MGIIATLQKLTNGTFSKKGNSPSDTVQYTAEGFEGQTQIIEAYHPAGFASIAGDDTKGVSIPVGASKNYSIIVATHNYNISISLEKGETIIFSTSGDGKTKKAFIKLNKDGIIEANGNTKNLVTHAELQTALSALATTIGAHVHASNGVPSPTLVGLTCDITNAKANTIKTG